jgi:signal transduction histidine kinase
VAGAGRVLECRAISNGVFVTDVRLLGRVLGNMLRNALEATQPGGTVTLTCESCADRVVFSVHNAAVMPEHVQVRLFRRSFSTKGGRGRGLGTHSIKLLGEQYLRGSVTFVSREPEGTTFSISLPQTLHPVRR